MPGRWPTRWWRPTMSPRRWSATNRAPGTDLGDRVLQPRRQAGGGIDAARPWRRTASTTSSRSAHMPSARRSSAAMRRRLASRSRPTALPRRRRTRPAVQTTSAGPRRAISSACRWADPTPTGEDASALLYGSGAGRNSTSCSAETRTTSSVSVISWSWSNSSLRRPAGETQKRHRVGSWVVLK